MIAGYVKFRENAMALKPFETIQAESTKQRFFIFACFLNACSSIGALQGHADAQISNKSWL